MLEVEGTQPEAPTAPGPSPAPKPHTAWLWFALSVAVYPTGDPYQISNSGSILASGTLA